MTLDLILQLIGLSIGLVGQLVKGNPTDLEQQLLKLVQTGVKAYESEKGQPIDPSLIKPIDEIP